MLSFLGLSFDRILLEFDLEPKTVVEVELESHFAELLPRLAFSLLLDLLLVFFLKISEVSVDVLLSEVLDFSIFINELSDVGLVHLLSSKSFELE